MKRNSTAKASAPPGATSATGRSTSSTRQIRNAAGIEKQIAFDPEKVTKIKDLYSWTMLDSFFDGDQLVPPPNRVKWLVVKHEAAAEKATEASADNQDFDENEQSESLSERLLMEDVVAQPSFGADGEPRLADDEELIDWDDQNVAYQFIVTTLHEPVIVMPQHEEFVTSVDEGTLLDRAFEALTLDDARSFVFDEIYMCKSVDGEKVFDRMLKKVPPRWKEHRVYSLRDIVMGDPVAVYFPVWTKVAHKYLSDRGPEENNPRIPINRNCCYAVLELPDKEVEKHVRGSGGIAFTEAHRKEYARTIMQHLWRGRVFFPDELVRKAMCWADYKVEDAVTDLCEAAANFEGSSEEANGEDEQQPERAKVRKVLAECLSNANPEHFCRALVSSSSPMEDVGMLAATVVGDMGQSTLEGQQTWTPLSQLSDLDKLNLLQNRIEALATRVAGPWAWATRWDFLLTACRDLGVQTSGDMSSRRNEMQTLAGLQEKDFPKVMEMLGVGRFLKDTLGEDSAELQTMVEFLKDCEWRKWPEVVNLE
ncbi:unnamed protein product [Amoebophrya sp. A120]|nr:unnamed protein product [Amoebophrya sp. A120]|eukprot:GSA120T00024883001.1